MTLKQRLIDVDVTSWRRIGVDMTLFKGCVSAGHIVPTLLGRTSFNCSLYSF